MKKVQCFLLLAAFGVSLNADGPESIYDFTVTDINGNEVSLKDYEGKTLLIVNVASKCGYTPQYAGLQELYERYRDRGLVILGFPSNDFLFQEPGADLLIKQFCTANYGVTFPMFSKIKVTGAKKAPLYKYLTDKQTNPDFGGRITWNFNKFLIDGNGRIVDRFSSGTEPLDSEVVEAVERAL